MWGLKSVGDHDSLDHVGEDRGPWSTAQPDRDHHAVVVTADASVDPDQPRRTPEARTDQPSLARLPRERAGGGCELDGAGRHGGGGHVFIMNGGCHTRSVASPAVDDSALSPLQRKTLGVLRRSGEPVVFDPAFVARLQGDIEEAFELFTERLGDETVFMSKHRMSSVLGCEVQHLLDDAFAWSPAVAGGQVAHRAIQLLINWRGDPVPADVVDEAIARLADDDTSLGDWIAGLTDADRADLTSFAVDKLIKFLECFPPLDKRAGPTTESTVRWPLEGPIMLSGKVDLMIGRPIGAESRKVIVDLKTGWSSPKHREDLRFYALVETLRTQVPPRKLASFYLDAGQPVVEDVTEATLLTASRRMLDAVNADIELRVEGRTPVKRPGASCRWCPLADDCPEGRAHLARRRDEDDVDLV
jgi:hypothetical protein